MTDRIRVSVVIPAFGRPELLEKTVRSALAQDLEADRFEVIVVDSSPDDRNADVVRRLQDGARCRLRLLRKKAEGPGPSRNMGAGAAAGDVIAFLDSDCEATPGWLRAGLAAFEDGVGLVQGRTIPEPGVPHTVFHRTLEIRTESVFYETANIFYRREAFEEAGGFYADPEGGTKKLFVGGEDADLAWRVKDAGWESRFAEDALVEHAVLDIPWQRWFFEHHLSAVPLIVNKHPRLRRYFYARYFYNRNQAFFVLALVGLVAAPILHPAALLLALPYVVDRTAEPSKTLKGPLRLLRVVFYLPRDLATFLTLLRASVRYRALLL